MTDSKAIEALEQLNSEYLQFQNEIKSSSLYSTGERLKSLKTRSASDNAKVTFDFLRKSLRKKRTSESTELFFYEKGHLVREAKGVVYTCITGNYDAPHTPLLQEDNIEYVCISDKAVGDGVWKYKELPQFDENICGSSVNRYCKMHPAELFPGYDFSVYIDGSVRPISTMAPLYSVARGSKCGIAVHRHPVRNGILDEGNECIFERKGNKKAIQRQIMKYQTEKMPDSFALFEATVLVTDLHNENARLLYDEWWKEFCRSSSGRDQLSLPYVLWKSGYSENDIGILGNDVKRNPKFQVFEHRK